jgi:hypothetical protein
MGKKGSGKKVRASLRGVDNCYTEGKEDDGDVSVIAWRVDGTHARTS